MLSFATDPVTGRSLSTRLSTVEFGQATTFTYTYDPCGHLLDETLSRHFEWDYTGRMRVFRTQSLNAPASEHAHYLYDAGGQRVLKLVRYQSGDHEVTVYIDGVFEEYRWAQGTTQPKRTTRLHVMDNQSRIAAWRLGDSDDAKPATLYHLGDHLGNNSVVINARGGLVNREEFLPYGETSFGSFARKRYRFTGKRRDEESGLYYYGARYYAPWVATWVSCDPAGTVGGLNLFTYAGSNPVRYSDKHGLTKTDTGPPANICYQPQGVPDPETGFPIIHIHPRDSTVIHMVQPLTQEKSPTSSVTQPSTQQSQPELPDARHAGS